MSLLKRIGNLIRSNVNDALDKAEDPRKILEQTILDMTEEHKNAKKRLIETLALQKQAERQVESFKKSAADWEAKAMTALKAGNEDLARTALTEKGKVDDLLQEAEAGVTQQQTYTEELKRSLAQLDAKITEAKGKRDELLARLSAAEMKKKQADLRQGITSGNNALADESSFDTFERMVAKIENSEAEVEARKELLGDSEADAALAALDRDVKQSSADAALAALKAKMATGGETPSATTPTPPSTHVDPNTSAVDDELAKLRAKLAGGGA
ncbi:MAG: PspA/IM30 family protein [Myxococcota bacterium]